MHTNSLRFSGLFTAIALATAGCSTTLKRYNSALQPRDDGNQVSATVFSLPLPPTESRTVLSLGERGQAAAVNALSTRTSTATDLLAALAAPLEAAPQVAYAIDRTKIKRRLVLSVRHDQRSLADRIIALRVTISTSPGGARFLGMDKLTTKYETTDLGKVVTTSQSGFSAGLGATRSSEESDDGNKSTLSLAPTLSVSAGRSVAEEMLLRQRYIAVSGELSEHSVTVILEGTPGIDLAGNTLADIDIGLPRDGVSWKVVSGLEDVFEKDGKLQCPSHATLRYTSVVLPPSADVWAHIRAEYTVRHVVSGENTLNEGDDKIELVSGKVADTDSLLLVGQRDLSAVLWAVYMDGRYLRVADAVPLSAMANRPTGSVGNLVFSNGTVARQFVRAIRECSIAPFLNQRFYLDDDRHLPLTESHRTLLYAEPWDVQHPED